MQGCAVRLQGHSQMYAVAHTGFSPGDLLIDKSSESHLFGYSSWMPRQQDHLHAHHQGQAIVQTILAKVVLHCQQGSNNARLVALTLDQYS